MKSKIKIEEKFLLESEELILQLLNTYMNSAACKLDAFTKAKMKGMLTRMINQEIDYFHDDPVNYFEIYGEDHLNN